MKTLTLETPCDGNIGSWKEIDSLNMVWLGGSVQ